jgi:hypothetical protein
MAHPTRKMDSALDLLRTRGTLRPRDLEAQGIPGDYLNRLSRRGLAEQVSRGLYAWPGYEVTEHHSLVSDRPRKRAAWTCTHEQARFSIPEAY